MKTLKELQQEINKLEADKKKTVEKYDEAIKQRQDIIDAEVEKRKALCVEGFYEDNDIVIYEKYSKKETLDAIKVLSDPSALKALIDAKNNPVTKVNISITKPFIKVLAKEGFDSNQFIKIDATDVSEVVIKGVGENE